MKEDQAPSAILELVDGPKDIRFAMTARTVARLREEGKEVNDMTLRNVEKVTQFRPGGEAAFESMIKKVKNLRVGERDNAVNSEKRWGGTV